MQNEDFLPQWRRKEVEGRMPAGSCCSLLLRLKYIWRRLSRVGKLIVGGVAVTLFILAANPLIPWPEEAHTAKYIEILAYRMHNLYYCVECSAAQANCFPSCFCPEEAFTKRSISHDNTTTDMEGRCHYSTSSMNHRQEEGGRKEAYVFYFSCDIVHDTRQDDKEEGFRAFIASLQVAMYSVIKSGTTRPIVLVIAEDEEESPLCQKYAKYLTWIKESSKKHRKQFHVVRIARLGDEAKQQRFFRRLTVFGLYFDRVIVLGEDVVVLRNMDILFGVDHTPAFVFNHTIWDTELRFTRYMGNSGLMVIDPHPKLYTLMMTFLPSNLRYYETDLGYIVSFFKVWYQLPRAFLFDKFIVGGGQTADIQRSVIDKVYALRYRGNRRPLECPSKMEDCNTERFDDPAIWDEQDRPFKSDAMHQLWWRFYDEMVQSEYFPALPPPS